MAYIVGKDDKDKKNPMGLLDSPGSFRNIKQQLQQDQLSQAIQPVHQAPMQPEKKEDQMKRFFNGGLVKKQQHFEEGDIVEIEGEGAGVGYKPKAIDQKSGQFVNIQDYLAANKARSAALGEKIASQFEQEASDIGEGIAETESEYLGEEGTYGEGAEDFIDETIAGAGEQELSEEQQSEWDELRDASQGPDLQEGTAAAGALQERAQALGTGEGRYAALHRALGDRYQTSTRGGSRLDQAIVGSDRATNTDMIKRAREASKGLKSKYTNLGEGIQQAEQDRRKQIQEGLTKAVSDQDARIKAQQEKFADLSFGSEITDAELKVLGLTREQVENLFGVDPSDYIKEGGISAQDFARYGALANLGGTSNNPYGGSEVYEHSIGDAIANAQSQYEYDYGQGAQEAGMAAWQAELDRWQRDDAAKGTIESHASTHPKILWPDPTQSPFYKNAHANAQATAKEKYKYGEGLVAPGELPPEEVVPGEPPPEEVVPGEPPREEIIPQPVTPPPVAPPPVTQPPIGTWADGGIMNSFLKRYKR